MLTEAMICEGCELTPAEFSLVITNSTSTANIVFGCWPCTRQALDDWAADPGDCEGYEVKRLHTPCPGCSTDGSNAMGLAGHLSDCAYNPLAA